LNHLSQLREVDPAPRVHLQAQIKGKMPKAPRYQSAQLFRPGLIQNKLTGKSALTMLFSEKSVLRATLDHQ
jgi:hypothetical protein